MYQSGRGRKDLVVPLLAVSPPLQHGQQRGSSGASLSAAASGPQGGGSTHNLAVNPSRGVLPTGIPGRSATSLPPGEARQTGLLRNLRLQQSTATIAPGQPIPAARQRDKFVPLPDDDDGDGGPPAVAEGVPFAPPPMYRPRSSLFEDLPVQIGIPPPPPGIYPSAADDGTSKRGRVTLYCVAESFERKKLEELLRTTYPPGTVLSYPDVFYVEYIKGEGDQPGGDVFFFDYGVVACWGMTKSQEMTLVRGIARQCQVQPLPDAEVETDEFQYNFTAAEKPHVQNDTVTLHRRFANDHQMKLAITYALAQSTKLAVYEQRVVDIVLETRSLPESLAESGEVDISATEIAKLIGKVFLQKSAVNLLSSVLDTPEFFWHAPDAQQTLYNRVNEYLELPARVELLNSRFSVLQEMLDMLRDHQNNYHNARLEWIVIWLIVVEVVVGLFELLGLFGVVGVQRKE